MMMIKSRMIRSVIAKVIAGAYGLLGTLWVYVGFSLAIAAIRQTGVLIWIMVPLFIAMGGGLLYMCGLVIFAYTRKSVRYLAIVAGITTFYQLSEALHDIEDVTLEVGKMGQHFLVMIVPILSGIASYYVFMWLYRRDFESNQSNREDAAG